jgi:hypothetical protein
MATIAAMAMIATKVGPPLERNVGNCGELASIKRRGASKARAIAADITKFAKVAKSQSRRSFCATADN